MRRFVAGAAIAALSGVLLGCGNEKPPEPVPADESPDVKVTACRFDGVESAVAAARGKVVLIDCWATWCRPCVASFPKLVEKHAKYSGRGLAVISLSLDDPDAGERVASFLKRQKATFTNLHLREDEASEKGLVEKFGYEGGIPHAVLFDRKGKRVWAGHPMNPELTDRIEAELAK